MSSPLPMPTTTGRLV